MENLPVIQKTYDCIRWYVPILSKLPRHHRYTLGDRMIASVYDLLEGLITARYSRNKLPLLETLNSKLDILRYQTRLMQDFELISGQRYENASILLHEIGLDLGGWIKQQRRR